MSDATDNRFYREKNEQRSSKEGVSGRTVSVWETPSTPCPPHQLKTYTFAELRETFDPGDLVYLLVDEIERLQQHAEKLENICGAAYQLAGLVGAPVRFLDALSRYEGDIDNLCPVSLDECEPEWVASMHAKYGAADEPKALPECEHNDCETKCDQWSCANWCKDCGAYRDDLVDLSEWILPKRAAQPPAGLRDQMWAYLRAIGAPSDGIHKQAINAFLMWMDDRAALTKSGKPHRLDKLGDCVNPGCTYPSVGNFDKENCSADETNASRCEHDWWRMKDHENRCIKCDATEYVP